MLFGACAGSTTGGIKCIRIAIMSRISKNEFKHIIHPNAILPVRINHQVVSSTTKSAVLAFIFLYMAIIFIGWLVLMLFGVGFEEAYSVVISSLGNVGPGIGKCGPSYSWSGLPDAAKWNKRNTDANRAFGVIYRTSALYAVVFRKSTDIHFL